MPSQVTPNNRPTLPATPFLLRAQEPPRPSGRTRARASSWNSTWRGLLAHFCPSLVALRDSERTVSGVFLRHSPKRPTEVAPNICSSHQARATGWLSGQNQRSAGWDYSYLAWRLLAHLHRTGSRDRCDRLCGYLKGPRGAYTFTATSSLIQRRRCYRATIRVRNAPFAHSTLLQERLAVGGQSAAFSTTKGRPGQDSSIKFKATNLPLKFKIAYFSAT